MKKIKIEWKKLRNNEVLNYKDFYISYNPNTNKEKIGELYNLLGGVMGGLSGIKLETDGRAETALCKKGEPYNKYFILNGDFRKEYTKLAPKGFKACFAFYKSKPKLQSNWSNE